MRGQVGSVLSNNANMAATITADMKSCHRQLGRPPKYDTDKRQRQQEAYKKRDASRVYLASSYERWKRLGAQLGLKDSSLAWHLMEAHATNCDECGLNEESQEEDESSMECKKNPSQFFPALVRSIHKLCHRYYNFGDCVQVVGLICLEVDNGKKENFSIKEMVHKPFMLHLTNNNNDSISNKHNDIPINPVNNKCCKEDHSSDDDNDSDHGIGVDLMETDQLSPPSDKNTSLSSSNFNENEASEISAVSKVEDVTELNQSNHSDEKDSSFISVGDEEFDVNKNHKENHQSYSPKQTRTKPVTEDFSATETTEDSADDSINRLVICDANESINSCPDSSPFPSNNIPQSKCDNSQINNAFSEETPITKDDISIHKNQSTDVNMCNTHEPSTLECAEEDVQQQCFDLPIENERDTQSGICEEDNPEKNYKQLDIEIPSEPTLGLDLSIVKTETSDSFQSPDNQSKSNRKRKSSEMEPLDKDLTTSHFSPSYLNGNTRREIVYKVEYEHLEKNPFCDFYELTARFPNIQQRTFYRWKRKIKDEFIFLEQNPDMSYEEFCACVSHAKPEVFDTWKKLIKDGHRFSSAHVSPTDASSNHTTCKKSDIMLNPSLAILQMYPHMSYQEFSYTHPMISLEMYSTYKQQVLLAISHVEQHPNIKYNELSKQYKFVTEDAFNAWKKYAQMINAQNLTKPVKEELGDKSTPSSLYAMQSAMLQQYPMLMGSAGIAAYNALLNQAMVTGNSSGQLYPALMQAAVSQAHHPYLPNNWQQQSLAAVHSQTQSLLLNQAQQQLLLHNQSSPQSSLSKLQSLTQVMCNNMKDCDKSSMSSTSPDLSSPISTDNTLKKQNKNEYLYFIYNADITYSEFSQQYPHISNRTFYRWKKEVRDAQMLLVDNPQYTYEDFCSQFPNIPQDIFDNWKLKQATSKTSPQKVWRPHDTASAQDTQPREPNRILKAVLENDNPSDIIKIPQYRPHDYHYKSNKSVDESSTNRPSNEEYEYVQLNPTISFNHFETIFPNVSEDRFNQWKVQINDCMNIIYSNPDIDYGKFQSFFPDVSEDVFNRWKNYPMSSTKTLDERSHYLGSQHHGEKDYDKVPSSEDDYIDEDKYPDNKSNSSHNKQRKQARQEYLCLQENPFVDLQEVIGAFPSVSKRTLYRWKKEILQAVEFVRSQPEISYKTFSLYFPEVVENNFNRWKKAITAASSAIQNSQSGLDSTQEKARQGDSPLEFNSVNYEKPSEPSSTPDSYCQQDTTDQQDRSSTSSKQEGTPSPPSEDVPRAERRDFKFMVENPDIEYDKFSAAFPTLSQYKFYKWRNDIHRWISLIMSSPHIDYNIFTIYCQEVPEEIFLKWKRAALRNINGHMKTGDSSQHQGPVSDTEHPENNNETHNSSITNSIYFKSLKTLTPRSRKVNLREYHYFIQNPYMTFQELNEMFNTISGRTFYRWKKEVKEKLEYLEANLEADFKTFSKLFPDVTEDIFLTWKQKAAVITATKRTPMNAGHWWNVNHQAQTEDHKAVMMSESSKDSFESQSSGRYAVCKDDDRDMRESIVKSPPQSMTFPTQKRLLNSSFEKEEKYLKREVDTPYNDTGNTIQQMLHQYSNNYINYGITPNSSMYSQILSSTSPNTINPTGLKSENLIHNPATSASIFPTNANLPKRPLSSPMASVSPVNNCDEIYSPKFRKRQREEYCYLQQNPTMDFNEFTSHFPRVSIRTFYRWKKELKDDR